MKYKIKTIKGKFCLYEIQTDKVVYCSSQEIKIKDMCKKLNSGSGFDGHTPNFFLSSVTV